MTTIMTTKKRKLSDFLCKSDYEDLICNICYDKIIPQIYYISYCCKKMTCIKCLKLWHEKNDTCIICRKKNKTIKDYLLYFEGDNPTPIEKELQEEENYQMMCEENQMNTFLDLESGRLVQCEYCGNIWDGNAQCNCWQWLEYDVDHDSIS